MPELGELLRRAAGNPPDLPDFEMIQRRARPRIIARRVAAGAVTLAVGLACWAGTAAVLGDPGGEGVDVVDRVPVPTAIPPVALRKGLLEPGTYAGRVGAYDVLLERNDDNWGAEVVEPDWLALTYRQYMLHLQTWDGVVPPSSSDGSGRQEVPGGLVAWLVDNPRLSASEPIDVEVGGVQATQLDVRVVMPLETTPSECTGPCVILARVASDGELVDLEVGQRARVLILGPLGQQLVVFYRAADDEFAVLDSAVQALLADLTLKTSG
jgi:hypothetical protein